MRGRPRFRFCGRADGTDGAVNVKHLFPRGLRRSAAMAADAQHRSGHRHAAPDNADFMPVTPRVMSPPDARRKGAPLTPHPSTAGCGKGLVLKMVHRNISPPPATLAGFTNIIRYLAVTMSPIA